MPIPMMAVAAGVSLIGDLVKMGMDYATAQKTAERLKGFADEYGNIPLPAIQKEIAQQLGPSALEKYTASQDLVDAQRQSLGALKRVSDEGGATLTDKAVLNRLMGETGRASATADQRVLSSMAARGIGGGGQETLARQLQNQQFAERAQQGGLDIAGMAQQRALDAIMKRGGLAGDQRSQEFGEAKAKADAADRIAQWNAESTRSTGRYNNDQVVDDYGRRIDRLGTIQGIRTGAMNAENAGTTALSSGISGAGHGLSKAISPVAKFDPKTGLPLEEYDPYTGKKK